ncbi:MAG TPA: HAD family acid phosphatase, partial [Thermoanaerobaculia bacterium]|nr:HAD family acid phosphatase [Thermoanaerobaculia bacterium]
MKRAHRPLSLALLFLVVTGCASSAPSAAPPPLVAAPVPVASPAPAGTLPDDDLWVSSSAEYAAACWQAFALARERVERLAAGRAPGTWAVAIDADETVLSNVGFEIELAAIGKDYDETIWRRWVARGEATALPGAAP